MNVRGCGFDDDRGHGRNYVLFGGVGFAMGSGGNDCDGGIVNGRADAWN